MMVKLSSVRNVEHWRKFIRFQTAILYMSHTWSTFWLRLDETMEPFHFTFFVSLWPQMKHFSYGIHSFSPFSRNFVIRIDRVGYLYQSLGNLLWGSESSLVFSNIAWIRLQKDAERERRMLSGSIETFGSISILRKDTGLTEKNVQESCMVLQKIPCCQKKGILT